MGFKFYSSIVAQTVPALVDRGNISQWEYNNKAISGKTLLTAFNKTAANAIKDVANYTFYVPRLNGKAVIINGVRNAFSPFFNDDWNMMNKVHHVDMQYVPSRLNQGGGLFREMKNLRSVVNLNKDLEQLPIAFLRCYNFNYNVKLPGKIWSFWETFYQCYNLNQNIKLPNSATRLYHTFYGCNKLNQNIWIPSGVTDMYYAFYHCQLLNQNIQIPNKVTNMAGTFSDCRNLNQSIQVGRSVTNMNWAFENCVNLSGRINILSTEVTNSKNTFNGTSKAKQVYLHFKYANGTYTRTYNEAKYWKGKNGVTIYDLGTAP